MAVIIPIPQPGGRDAVFGFLPYEVGEAAHHVVVITEDLPVAEPYIVLPRHQHRCRAPLQRPVERGAKAPRRVAGRNRQYAPARFLRVADVTGDFAEPLAALVSVQKAGLQQVGTLKPAQLFPVRAIRHHPAHVGAHGRVNKLVRAIVEFARTGEAPGLGQPGPDRHQLQSANDREALRVRLPFRHRAGHLDKLHA